MRNFSIKMSVDVFGHHLDKKETVGRTGPPGNGFKLTDEGHYDLENKRLCNVGVPMDHDDAISFGIFAQEHDRLAAKVQQLQSDLDKLKELIESYIRVEYKLDESLFTQQP